METRPSFLSRVVAAFLQGQMPILLILFSLIAGAFALIATPREEEPQIVVPLADVLISYPGGSAEEIERLVAARLERMLYQIDGVEYVYSMSRPGMAVVTVRFYVGEGREDSLIKLYNKLQQNIDQVTPGIESWIVKPIEIDDVPIVNATLYSPRYDDHQLYRVAEEVVAKLQSIPNTARITLHGGHRRVLHVYLDKDRLAAYGLAANEIAAALHMANARGEAGAFERHDESIVLEIGPWLRDAREVANLLVGLHEDRPVYLRDIAEVVDGPDETATYSRFAFGPADGDRAGPFPAVTIAVAKKQGSNAVAVSRAVQDRLAELRGSVVPDDIDIEITRDYGATANDKVNNLVISLGLAILSVIALLAVSMSWREGLIVALAVPITYSLALLCNFLLGYTINRVTLFALILALGLIVDDPIVGVENINRRLRMNPKGERFKIIVDAMQEVLPPIVLSTLAIIISFTPMFFITGMMGPYMGPMALNVPVAVIMSTIVALTITPWLSSKLLKDVSEEASRPLEQSRGYRLYNRILRPLLRSRAKGLALLAGVGLLFLFAVGLAGLGFVPLKMLPFDNKDEFQLLIDLPESATLERTDAVTRELEDYLRTLPEVKNVVSVVGAATPMDFNGMVRHYYMRQGPHLADIRVNLLHRNQRSMDSHALTLRIRDEVRAISERHDANVKIIEVPPGPPVLATLVAEVYGSAFHDYDDLIEAARIVKARMAEEEAVVDLDSTIVANQRKIVFEVDRDKAGRHGLSTRDVVDALRLALSGEFAGIVHQPTEQNEWPIILRLPREARSDPARLAALPLKGRTSVMVQLGELGTFHEDVQDPTIYHKNLERVVYVTAEMAGRGPAYAVLNLQKHFREHPLPDGIRVNWSGEGEWKITIDVFRDLGIAFSAALLGIYILLVYQTASFLIPLLIMLSIPLTMIGIMPGFWLLNIVMNQPVGGFANPVFFTATAMIGMIALSGIVIRNALVLIEFIHAAVADGVPLEEAMVQSGAVRARPIFLTALTTMLGAGPITLDPIFSGLAWAIIFGMLVSTLFTLVVVPTVYGLVYGKRSRTKT